MGWWGSGRNIPAPLYSTACPEAKDQGGPFCSESQPRPENQWRERTSLETNTARPADRNKKICESPVNSSCEQCMMQNDTDESKPAFQQSARSKRQAMFRPGSLPPLQTCWASPAGGSTYLGGSDKTGESSQDPARGLLKLPQPETFPVTVQRGGAAGKAQKTPTAAAAVARDSAVGAESRQCPLWLWSERPFHQGPGRPGHFLQLTLLLEGLFQMCAWGGPWRVLHGCPGRVRPRWTMHTAF